jgi:hypothetical protein
MLGDAAQVLDGGPIEVVEPTLELGDSLALRAQVRLAQLRCVENLVDERVAELYAELREPFSCQLGVEVGREPEAEPELGVVLEERVGPGGATAVVIHRPRRRRQVAAIDRRAPGRVRDHETVAEELREELDVRRLPAAGARARELE